MWCLIIDGSACVSWADVLSGVPQGSVIGPPLFFISINVLPEDVHTMDKMFADHTKIFTDTSRDKMALELQEDVQ